MRCEHCGKDFEPTPGQDKCPHCGATVPPRREPIRDGASFTPGAPEGLRPPSEPAEGAKVSWDGEGPFFSRLWNTWTEVMFHPTRFFKAMPVTGGLGRPLVYALIVGTIGMLAAIFWQFIFTMVQIPFMTALPSESKGEVMLPFAFSGIFLIVWIFLTPIVVIIGQFIWSGILHLSLLILGGNKKGFEATFRVAAYGGWSPNIFGIIPFCGGMIGGIWSIVLVIIGLKEAHQISTGKAVLAYFLPLILCCGCGIILAIAFGAFGVAAAGAGGY